MTEPAQIARGRAVGWLAVLSLALLPSLAEAGWFRALGPHAITRQPGPISIERLPFEVADPSLPYRVRIFNGGPSGALAPVSSAVVRLNGAQIFGPVAFTRASPGLLEKDVTLRRDNVLTIRLSGHRGAMTVVVLGRDDRPPRIAAQISPGANAAGWHNAAGGVTVSFDCSDAESDISSCSDPVVLTEEGATRVVTGTAIDLGGNVATASAVVNLDLTPPAIDVIEPMDGVSTGLKVETEGSVADDLSGVAFAEVDGTPLALSASGEFDQSITLPGPGPRTLIYAAEDRAGNRAVEVEVGVVAAVSSGVEVKFESPGPGSIQYGSGWPLSLRVSLPEEIVGISIKTGGGDDDLRNGPFPQRFETGYVILDDEDSCPSFINFPSSDACRLVPIRYKGSLVEWWNECNFQPLPRNETLIEFEPQVDTTGNDRGLLRGLVVVPDSGKSLRISGGALIAAESIADWDLVAYELKDSAARTSIVAHRVVRAGDLWPEVKYEVVSTNEDPAVSESGTGLYRIDGGLRGCLAGDSEVNGGEPGETYCVRSDPIRYDFRENCPLGRPIEGRMEELYIPIFESVEVSLRAFMVELEPEQQPPCEIFNQNGDGVIDEMDALPDLNGQRFFRGRGFKDSSSACDTTETTYRLLSNVAETRFRQHYGAECRHGKPGALELENLNGSPDQDGDNGIEDFNSAFCNNIPESSPVGAGEPPR